MNYSQTIDYLFSRLPMYSRIGSDAFKKDLINIKLLCNYLGNPEKGFRSIHIGGTNGKGSTSHMLSAILQKAGYKTGLYTSPHLYDFRERIKINGLMVPEIFVIDFVDRIKPLIEEIEPSFFEITVAMAFVFFAQEKVDVAIVEVGLGGRLDSTNIINPLVSVITNIGWDHMNILGNSLTQIAGEKAGIIKSNTPVVIGERIEESANIFTTIANQLNAPIFFAEDRWNVITYNLKDQWLEVNVKDVSTQQSYSLNIDLPGIYQTKNIKTVLQTIEVLKAEGFSILVEHIQQALSHIKDYTGLWGRWEIIRKSPTVVLEVAHNEDGLNQMIAHINALSFNQLHIVFGMVKDKDAEKVLQILPKNALYYFTEASIPRALPALELQTKAASFSLKGQMYNDVNDALRIAINAAASKDLIIVCGSIFIVAEVNKSFFTT